MVEPLVADPSQLCPFLAFVDDPYSRALVATAEHRCYSTDAASGVSQQHQVVFCLQTRHADCSRFQPFVAAGQQPAAGAAVSRSRNWPLSAVAIIVAVIVGGVAVGAVVGNPLSVEPDAGRAPTPIATLAPSPSPAVTPIPLTNRRAIGLADGYCCGVAPAAGVAARPRREPGVP